MKSDLESDLNSAKKYIYVFINNMQISKISYQPFFGTSYRKVYKSDKPYLLDHEASTCCFKNDYLWNKSFDFFIDKYRFIDNVNVYSLASSDCSEALSIAMILDTKLGSESEKYFPIYAVDSDEGVLENIRNGFIDLAPDDEVRINHYTNNNLNKYLRRTSYSYLSGRIGDTDNRKLLTRFIINPELLKKIKVICDDVNTYTDSLPAKNNLIFSRNMWVYMHPKQNEYLHKLSNIADENSFLSIGNYDYLMCPLTIKNTEGFSMHPELINVYDKSGSNYFDDLRLFTAAQMKDY